MLIETDLGWLVQRDPKDREVGCQSNCAVVKT